MTQRFYVGSKNPVKVQAMASALRLVFPATTYEVLPFAAESGVADQPASDEETLRGALNRLDVLRHAQPDAAGWAAIEGGIQDTADGMWGLAWVVVRMGDRTGKARTATFPLPNPLAALVRSGIELGLACDELYRRTNTKQGSGAIGILTDGLITRHALYEHAAVMALQPCANGAFLA